MRLDRRQNLASMRLSPLPPFDSQGDLV